MKEAGFFSRLSTIAYERFKGGPGRASFKLMYEYFKKESSLSRLLRLEEYNKSFQIWLKNYTGQDPAEFLAKNISPVMTAR